MAHLLETRAEPLLQELDVVPKRTRRLEKLVIWHHERGGEIPGKRGPRQFPRGVRRQGWVGRIGLQYGVGRHQADLVGEVETHALVRQRFRQHKSPFVGIEPPNRHAEGVRRGTLDVYLKTGIEEFGQSLDRAARSKTHFPTQFGGPVLEFGKEVPILLDEVADFLVRRVGAEKARRPLALPVLQHLADDAGKPLALAQNDAQEPLAFARLEIGVVVQDLGKRPDGCQQGQQLMARRRQNGLSGETLPQGMDGVSGVAIGVVQRDQGAADLGVGADQILDLPGIRALILEQGVAEHLLEIRHQTDLVFVGKGLQIDIEEPRQLEHQGQCQRPLVVLDEVEIARRNAQPLGHRDLAESGVAPEFSDLVAEQGFPSHGAPITYGREFTTLHINNSISAIFYNNKAIMARFR